ncbi:hypothetical protein [Streptomyces nitrosporeus]|uniref:hypothetical protein n=1 Tax=Streptomyces nitrosporeus TaxID=28894 RepID=UPI00332272C0
MSAPTTGYPWRDAWPPVARPGDGGAWVVGACWLYCRREDVAVLWVGTVTTPGATGDVYACGPCLVELGQLVRAQAHARDVRAVPAGPYATVRPVGASGQAGAPGPIGGSGPSRGLVCEHRRTERRGGTTYCQGCGRQLYL